MFHQRPQRVGPLLTLLRRQADQVASRVVPVGPARRFALDAERRAVGKLADMGSEQSSEPTPVNEPLSDTTGTAKKFEHKHTQTDPYEDDGFDMTVSRKWLRVLGRIGLLGRRRECGRVPGSDDAEHTTGVFCCGPKLAAWLGRM